MQLTPNPYRKLASGLAVFGGQPAQADGSAEGGTIAGAGDPADNLQADGPGRIGHDDLVGFLWNQVGVEHFIADQLLGDASALDPDQGGLANKDSFVHF